MKQTLRTILHLFICCIMLTSCGERAKVRKQITVRNSDSSSCGSCRIARFWDMMPLYERSESDGRFSVMAIFSPTIDELPEMERQLMALDFPYPVYVDIYREFALHNRIPADSRFHDFLIDDNGTVLFVGNPLGTDRLMEVFNKALNNFKQ